MTSSETTCTRQRAHDNYSFYLLPSVTSVHLLDSLWKKPLQTGCHRPHPASSDGPLGRSQSPPRVGHFPVKLTHFGDATLGMGFLSKALKNKDQTYPPHMPPQSACFMCPLNLNSKILFLTTKSLIAFHLALHLLSS